MSSGMQRPRRQAAAAALESMRRVHEWEDMSENSKRFRECAAQIEAEFQNEESTHMVRTEDLDTDMEDGAESTEDSECKSVDSFISDDGESEDGEYNLDADKDDEGAEDSQKSEEEEGEQPPELADEQSSVYETASEEEEATEEEATEPGAEPEPGAAEAAERAPQ